MTTANYKDLIAWRKSMDLVEIVYQVTRGFPRDEIFGLSNQLRRAAISVPSNIAEGQGRGAGKAFALHLRVAKGSLQELETQLLIAQRLGFISDEQTEKAIDASNEVVRLVCGLLRSVRSE